MEKKTKHRIFGILVVIAVAIILLPLFPNHNEHLTNAAVIKAPPFPDQSVQVASNIPEQISEPVKDVQPFDTTKDEPKDQEAPIKTEPEDTIRMNKPSIVENTNNKKTTSFIKPSGQTLLAEDLAREDRENAKTKVNSHTNSSKHLAKNEAAIPFEIKQATWVVQMGNFRNKENALKLVNHLRMNGYKAFIKKSMTVLGESTRVYVGPELQKTSAEVLANRLRNDLHLKGFIVNYKPLEL